MFRDVASFLLYVQRTGIDASSRVTAIAHAKPTAEHAIIMRCAGVERPDRAGGERRPHRAEQSHSCPDTRRMKEKHDVTDYT
jgi:hypothetical protein